ncbi:MAG: phasin family protein [Gammaproteobacteria bacterium]|nr:MAG: phasin family protein [Gammaproteobacteria bacterium]
MDVMTDQIWTNLADNAQKALEPVSKLNELFVANLQKVAEFQMDALKSYADLASSQFTALTEIHDADSLKDFLTRQTEVAGELSQKIMEDLRTLGEMGSEFREEVTKVMEEVRETVTDGNDTEKAA